MSTRKTRSGSKSASGSGAKRSDAQSIKSQLRSSGASARRVSYVEISSDDDDDNDVDDGEVAADAKSTPSTTRSRPERVRQLATRGDEASTVNDDATSACDDGRDSVTASKRRKHDGQPGRSMAKKEGCAVQAISSDDSDDAEGSASEAESNNGDDIEFRIQHILGKQIRAPVEWRKLMETQNTQELIKGSVLKQPDSEFFSTDPEGVEKYFVKWEHSSFLHCSWETLTDLSDLVGKKFLAAHLKRFHLREVGANPELYEDLSAGEYFPPQYITVERIIDLEVPQPEIKPADMTETAMEPNEDDAKSDVAQQLVSMHCSRCESELQIVNAENDPGSEVRLVSELNWVTVEEMQWLQSLSPRETWLTLKWSGQAYGDLSVECLADLISMNVDYLIPLLSHYRFVGTVIVNDIV
jgi:hypothetical protein